MLYVFKKTDKNGYMEEVVNSGTCEEKEKKPSGVADTRNSLFFIQEVGVMEHSETTNYIYIYKYFYFITIVAVLFSQNKV